MKIEATPVPQDAYALSGIAAGTTVQIQNLSNRTVRIYAGAAAPASMEDYFMIRPYSWEAYEGAVIMLYAGQRCPLAIQEAT